MIHGKMFWTGKGSSKNNPIHLPEQVSPPMLSLIHHYWRFHLIPRHSDKERRSFDEKFVKTDADCLLELVSAAHALQLRPLVDLTSRTIARRIEGCSNDEIREIFHVPDDPTENMDLENKQEDTRPIEELLELINGKGKGVDATRIPSNDYSYSEGDLDQEKMRENDRIVADFARKLNVVDYY